MGSLALLAPEARRLCNGRVVMGSSKAGLQLELSFTKIPSKRQQE